MPPNTESKDTVLALVLVMVQVISVPALPLFPFRSYSVPLERTTKVAPFRSSMEGGGPAAAAGRASPQANRAASRVRTLSDMEAPSVSTDRVESGQHQLRHLAQLLRVAAHHEQRGDRRVAPGREALLDARDRAHQRDLVGEAVGHGADRLLPLPLEEQLLDLVR